MTKPLSNDDFPLKRMFSGTVFAIPEYQRYYSWERSHLEDLWKDIHNILSANKQHYMGTVICKHEGTEEAEYTGDLNKYYIVDGQQRLTTLVILMKTLLSAFKNIDLASSVDDPNTLKEHLSDVRKTYIKYPTLAKRTKMRLQGDDNHVFEHILDDEDAIQSDTPSQERLVNTRKFFITQLERELDEKNNREKTNYLLKVIKRISELQFMVYVIDTEEQAALIFETINDRGKPLSNLEKTKSFLMHKLYLTEDEKSNRRDKIEAIKRNFTDIYKAIQDIEDSHWGSDIGEDDIQRYHFIASTSKAEIENYFDEVKPESTTKTREYASSQRRYLNVLKWWFDKLHSESKSECSDEIVSYVKDLRKFFHAFQSICTGNNLSQTAEKELNKLFVMGRVANFYPLILVLYNDCYTDNKISEQEFEDILQLVEIAAFRIYAVGGRRSDTGRSRFYRYAYNYYHKSNADYAKEKLVASIRRYEPEESFEQHLRSKKFFNVASNSDIRYLFYFYDRELHEKGMTDQMDSLTLRKVGRNIGNNFTVEHIWARNIKKLDLQTEEDERIHADYVHRLGNLTLETGKLNSSMKDAPYEEKKERYRQSGFLLTRHIQEKYEDWGPDQIENRTDEIVDFVMNRWSIN